MAEYNNQSIDIDLEEVFNGLSNKGQEEFLSDMFRNLFDEGSRYNVVSDNMKYLQYDEDKEEYLNPDYYKKWRDNYTKLCEQLSKERDHAEKNSKDSLVKGYGKKYGGVYHDIQDNIQKSYT